MYHNCLAKIVDEWLDRGRNYTSGIISYYSILIFVLQLWWPVTIWIAYVMLLNSQTNGGLHLVRELYALVNSTECAMWWVFF